MSDDLVVNRVITDITTGNKQIMREAGKKMER